MPKLTLDPSAATFSRQNALYLANACSLAYSNEPAEDAREILGLEAEPFRHDHSDTQGFAGRGPDYAVLVFRGSEQINEHPKDWFTNLRFAQAQQDPITGLVHAGFSSTLAAAWDEIEAVLRRALVAIEAVGADEPGLPLYITGHSLGGALATLAACRLGSECLPALGDHPEIRLNLKDLYTFGAPRVGDPDFCQSYKPRIYRVVHNLDIVPLLPLAGSELKALHDSLPTFAPEWMKSFIREVDEVPSYGHVGTLVHLDSSGKELQAGPRTNWLAAYSRQLIMSLGSAIDAPVRDHMIGAYMSAIDR